MQQITITEGLARLKTLAKRIEAKKQYITQYSLRNATYKDPLEKQGGSEVAVAAAFQSLHDLQQYLIAIRRSINMANERTEVTVGNTTRTISEWLIWKREVLPAQLAFLNNLNRVLEQRKAQATKTPTGESDIVINVDEAALFAMSEELATVLSELDGQLSLKNATVTIDLE